MLKLESPTFESWRAPLAALQAELGGDLIAAPGSGGDYMLLIWVPEPKKNPGWQIGERVIGNPALPGQSPFEDTLREARLLFLYNQDRTKNPDPLWTVAG